MAEKRSGAGLALNSKAIARSAAMAVALIFPGQFVRADIPSALEPAYSEAVLAYSAKDFAKTVTILDGLIAKQPTVVEFLELKALALKTMNEPEKAGEAYQELIKIKTDENRPEKEIAPYNYELGQILFNKGDSTGARECFHHAIHSNYNVAPSRFFLGLIYFKERSFEMAEAAFRSVAHGDVEDLKPSAQYYIGQSDLQMRYPGGATQAFFAARRVATDQINSESTPAETKKMAQQIYDAATKNLEPFSRSKFFGNVTLITGYDSNVLSVPSNQASTAQGGTGQASVKETLEAGLGYMTSPLEPFQFVPSYRGSYNYDFNQGTRAGEFLTHDFSMYLTHNALAATSYGLKTEGIYTMQDQVDSDTNNGTLKPYSLALSIGPYWKTEITRKAILGAEFYVSPIKNYLDHSLTNTAYYRSGTDISGRVTLKSDSGGAYWNPGAFLGIDRQALDGAEYKSTALLVEVNNAMHLSDATQLGFNFDYSPVDYGDRPEGTRIDRIVSIDGNVTERLTDKLSLLGEIQYLHNGSSVPETYQYNRLLVSTGLSYSL